jgi:endonuclease/exonuclease/phosphatase family metal-dependent hydrolase
MKLVTWNCRAALHKKHQRLLTLGADIMVIQECTRPNLEQAIRSEGWSSAWFGDTPREKALGVLVKPPGAIREMRALKPKWAGRVVIDGPASIELFPVWAHRGTTSGLEYIEQVHSLLDIIDHTSLSPFTIVAGDFNSNSIWDRDYGLKSHTAAVRRFHKLGLESAYHRFFGESQGAEKRPTHWNNKNGAPYHIGYAFLSLSLLSKLRNVEVGSHHQWHSSSDHVPVLVEIDL